MKLKAHIKKGDEVEIIAGNDKGKKGKVLAVFIQKNRVIVEGVRKMKKAIKPSEENKKGGFIEVESPIHLSNVCIKK